MKVNKTLIILACMIFVFAGSNLMAATLQIGSVSGAPGQVVSIPISAAESSEGIAGAAFTITYDTSKLSPASGEPVKSEFFDTFEVQLKAANPNYTGAVEADGYDKPLVSNVLSGTGIAFAAARVQAAGADDPEILFTVDLLIDSEAAPEDTYDIKVIPTVLNNTNAGYDANGEEIDLLIGADATITDPTDPNAYPVLLSKDVHDAEATKGTVTVSPETTFDIPLQTGWNMVSLPFTPTDSSLSTLFPEATDAFKFSPGIGYEEVTALDSAKVGYWVKVPADKVYNLSGQEVSNYTVALTTGWNLVGSASGSDIVPTTDPANSITDIFKFTPGVGYEESTAFNGGFAYWVKVSQACDLIVGSK